jgi:hypothetical protein
MYHKRCWWRKPIIIICMMLAAVGSGLAFGMIIEALVVAIG